MFNSTFRLWWRDKTRRLRILPRDVRLWVKQRAFSGAAWALADTVDRLDSVVEGMMQRTDAA